MKAFTLAGLALVLTGCVATTGNFAHTSPSLNGQLAHDAVKVITATTPAKSHDSRAFTDGAAPIDGPVTLQLKGDPKDSFHQSLRSGLRDAGFALTSDEGPAKAVPHHLAYILDRIGSDYLRLTLRLDDTALSRLYREQEGSLSPVSAWARQQP
jgi:hypothetical protein